MAEASVIVAGSINQDLIARAPRHPLTGETVLGRELRVLPGGKGANQAVAAARLGAKTRLIGWLGQDVFGDDLARFLGAQGVDLRHVRRTAAAATGTALIVVADSGDNTIVVIRGANDLLGPDDLAAVDIRPGDVLVSQFEIPGSAIERFFVRGRTAGARTLLNPAPARRDLDHLLGLADVLVVNETELAFFLDQDPSETLSALVVAEAARRLRSAPEQIVVVTLGPRGALALAGDRVIEVPGRNVAAIDTTGAGDCFVGALAARLADGAPAADALAYANLAASLCVQRLGAGAAMPSAEELAGHQAGAL